MFTRSLRGKIFLLVVAILLVLATFVRLVTQRDVTSTVEAGEQHAVDNVLNLVLRDTDARWSALLDDKISTVRTGRRQLVQVGNTISTVLAGYADMADRGVMTPGAAKGMARAWINRLKLEDRRYAFGYAASFSVLAAGNMAMTDLDLSPARDIKGRQLAQALYEESRRTGYGFAIYRWPLPGATGEPETRYAYFGYFRQWDWVFAVTDSAQDIIEQVQGRRAQMETAMRSTLSQLTLAHSGFVFIVNDNGRMVVPPPAHQTALLEAVGDTSRQPLRELLAKANKSQPQTLRVINGKDPWQIKAVHNKPLGWTVVAAVPESDLTAPAKQLMNRLAILFAITLLLALVAAWLIATRIARPLDKLTQYARQLPELDLTVDAPVPAHIAALPQHHRDEVGRLATSFLFMQRKLTENVQRLMQETSTRERFESELNIARAIQLGLLPVPLGSDVRAHVDLHATMLPAKQVGGDLYDYFMMPDGRLCLAIGDVSDKGVPAALFMAVTRTLIRATAEDETDPAQIMQKINNRLSENNPNMMFVTLLLGVLDLLTGELAWANAGHLKPIVIGADGALRTLEGRSGPACGVQEDLVYQPLHARLAPGEVLVGYTDGVTEAVNRQNQQYGDPRMLSVLASPPSSATAIGQRLLEDVQAFAAGAEQSDDITLIVVRRA